MKRGERKRASISLANKLTIISKVEDGKSQVQVAQEMQLPRSTIQTICSQKEKIKRLCSTTNTSFKKVRPSEFHSVDTALLEWFNLQRSRNLPINGPVLKQKALDIATTQNVESFTASDGWLSAWKKRHSIVFKVAAGEEAAVNTDLVHDWIQNVWPSISANYQPKDIYNADETGLFYRMLPQKTHDFAGKDCHGGKLAKDRLTVLLCVNADGSHKLKPLVIGKSIRPRCFKHIRDLDSLPVKYAANNKAWITTEIFTKWLREMNTTMTFQARKILLIVDNCAPHVAADLRLSHIRIVFLPPNATSKVQPLDRGIINSMKAKYRTLLLQKIILKMDAGETPKVDLLDAILGIQSAWSSVTEACIVNCFANSGIVDVRPDVEDLSGNQPSCVNPVASQMNMTSEEFDNFVNVDNQVMTCDEPTLEAIASGHVQVSSPEEMQAYDVSSESEEDDAISTLTCTNAQAMNCLETLRGYVVCKGGDVKMYELLNAFEQFVYKNTVSSLRQTDLTTFFK